MRQKKYEVLGATDFQQTQFKRLELSAPEYFFVPKDTGLKVEYIAGFGLEELCPVNSMGVTTARDDFTIRETRDAVRKTIEEFLQLDDETARRRFSLGKDARDWRVALARTDLEKSKVKGALDAKRFVPITYRPFDVRQTYYTGNSKGFHCMPRNEVMRHLLASHSLCLCSIRISRDDSFCIFVSKFIAAKTVISTKDNANVFPLYLYTDDGATRTPNLDHALVEKIAAGLGLRFVPEATSEDGAFAPLDLLDYIYAVLHTPSYRETFKEFLKIDFPRVPYPTDAARFRQLAAIGAELRALHLMESPRLDNPPFTFPVAGDNTVVKPVFKDGQVWINKTQYVGRVPAEVWDFHVGGYQPAQKWLKDRKGRALSYDDVRHYQKILVALAETRRLMTELDRLG